MTGDAEGGWEADFASVPGSIVGFKLRVKMVRKGEKRREKIIKCDKNNTKVVKSDKK